MGALRMVSVLVLLAMVVQVFSDKQQKRTRLGGWAVANKDDNTIQKVLEIAIAEYNKASKGDYILRVNNVKKVMQQVVAGMKYRMDIDVTFTKCISEDSLPEVCPNNENSSAVNKSCKFHILTVPWEDVTKLEKAYCG